MSRTDIGQVADKASFLLSLLPKRPLEFYDRLLTRLSVCLERRWIETAVYDTTEWREVIRGIEGSFGKQIAAFLEEPACAEILTEVCHGVEKNLSAAPFSLAHNADFTLAQLCYVLCRVTRPTTVLETGVAYGVTSAFILKALEVNGCGCLHSVDLPPLGPDADQFVGILIPKPLRHRWRLHRGASKRVLPSLLPRLKQVDVFVHDSLHTYRNMKWEFDMVTPYLAPGAIVIADDIDGNRAFNDWVVKVRPPFWATLREVDKKSLFGVGILSPAQRKVTHQTQAFENSESHLRS
jgi:hypothetical protein